MSSGASELTRGDSLDLLALGNLGVLIFTRNALNSTVPARYLVEPDRVLVHVMATTDTVPWRDGDVLTLCASAFDSDQRRGWNVSVTGRAHTPHLGGLDEPPTAPWIASGSGNLLEIKTDLVEGQRLGLDRNTTHNKTHRDRSALRTGSNLEDSQQ
jgi:hypothetical protein